MVGWPINSRWRKYKQFWHLRSGWSNRNIARQLGVHRETVGRHIRLSGGDPAAPGSDSKPASAPLGSTVLAAGGSTVLAAGGSTVLAAGGSTVLAAGGSTVLAAGGSTVLAAGGSTVLAAGGSTVLAAGGSTVLAAGGSTVLAAGGSESAPTGLSGAPIGSVSTASPWREVIVQKLEAGLTAQRIYQDISSDHGYAGSYYSVRRFIKKLSAAAPAPFRRMECEPGAEAQVDFGRGAPWSVLTANAKQPGSSALC